MTTPKSIHMGDSDACQKQINWRAIETTVEENAYSRLDWQANVEEISRTNAYAARIVSAYQSYVAGTTFSLSLSPDWELIGVGEDVEFSNNVSRRFNNWANSNRKNVDIRRDLNFLELLNLAVATVVKQGEFILVKESKQSPSGIMTTFRVVDPILLGLSNSYQLRPLGKNKIINGIELSAKGDVVAYHFYDESQRKSIRVTKYNRFGDLQVLHVFTKPRPNSLRGESLLLPILNRLKDLETFVEANIKKEQLSASMYLYVRSDFNNALYESLKDVAKSSDEQDSNSFSIFASGMKQYWNENELKVGGTVVPSVPTGASVETINYNNTAYNAETIVKTTTREVASGTGLPYSLVANDYTDATFSSEKAARSDFDANTNTFRTLYIDPIANFIFDSWFDEVVARGFVKIPLPNGVDTDKQFSYYMQNREAYGHKEWRTAARTPVDEAKAALSDKTYFELGVLTREQIAKNRGYPVSGLKEAVGTANEIEDGIEDGIENQDDNDNEDEVNNG